MKLNKGQSITEYLIVIGFIVAATIAMQTYVKRNIIGNNISINNYDPNYGDDKRCICDHNYSNHFDKYGDRKATMCKFCECVKFRQSSRKE